MRADIESAPTKFNAVGTIIDRPSIIIPQLFDKIKKLHCGFAATSLYKIKLHFCLLGKNFTYIKEVYKWQKTKTQRRP